jgi:hypothetical protein
MMTEPKITMWTVYVIILLCGFSAAAVASLILYSQ